MFIIVNIVLFYGYNLYYIEIHIVEASIFIMIKKEY